MSVDKLDSIIENVAWLGRECIARMDFETNELKGFYPQIIEVGAELKLLKLLIQRNTESKGEWVSVEGYTSEVLDHWAYHEDHKPRLCHLDVFGNGMWIDSITNRDLLPQPTHIMPINVPQPPKQGSQS